MTKPLSKNVSFIHSSWFLDEIKAISFIAWVKTENLGPQYQRYNAVPLFTFLMEHSPHSHSLWSRPMYPAVCQSMNHLKIWKANMTFKQQINKQIGHVPIPFTLWFRPSILNPCGQSLTLVRQEPTYSYIYNTSLMWFITKTAAEFKSTGTKLPKPSWVISPKVRPTLSQQSLVVKTCPYTHIST